MVTGYIKKRFYTSTAVYMYYVAICACPQESPDDGLPGPKHAVNLKKNYCVTATPSFLYLLVL
jgi:hypothetical protein